MRIVQLIDSLEAGGAERMAVSYANALSKKVAFSGIVVTRVEGSLKYKLYDSCSYLFLKRKKILDFVALLTFRKYLIKNKIEVLHAHSTSIFFAFLVKFLVPRIKIIWHDHYGNSELLQFRKSFVLKFVSFFLHGIIVVNNKLKDWSLQTLYCVNVIYLPNFTSEELDANKFETTLKGVDGKRILCLANLRPQKNHYLLFEIAQKTAKIYPDWTFHLVGKDFEDAYSKNIKESIVRYNLEKIVYLYGSRNDVYSIIQQSSIGILTSVSEGLPVALLEYGIGKLPVVSTDVGEISSIIQSNVNGFLFAVDDSKGFLDALSFLIDHPKERLVYGERLFELINSIYAEEPVMENYLTWINGK